MMKTFRKMLKIELKLNIRDMNMVIFAVVMPLIILLILGMIYGSQPAGEGIPYTFVEQSFGALCSIAICGSGTMGLPIMISEYRERKILKRLKATPVSPFMLLLVNFAIYALYALASMLLLWFFSSVFWNMRIHGSFIGFLGSWLLTLLCMFSIGILVGGVAKNSKQASMIASILYFPMLIFSGATLPYEVMPGALRKLADFMPLTQGIKLMKATLLGNPVDTIVWIFAVLIIPAVLCMIMAIRLFRWE